MKGRKWIACFILLLSPNVRAADLKLKVVRTEKTVTLDPLDKVWKKIKPLEVPLIPQVIAPPGGGGSVKKVWIQSLQSKEKIYFRLEWEDTTINEDPTAAQSFTDAVAIQFPENPSSWPSPFMGDQENPVVIWRWTASAQKDSSAGYQTASISRSRMTADLYPFEDDATFRTGEGAGNIISKRRRETPVENLAAKGFGTLTTMSEQPVRGKGEWKNGHWRVVFERELKGTNGFWSSARIPFALAVWDGQNKERNGMKSFSVWQTLEMPDAAQEMEESKVAQGHRVYLRYGCGTCHGKNGTGSVANPNAQVNPIPALNKVKETFTKEELQKVIFKGREPERADPLAGPPRFKMNAWESILSQSEADTLVEYLFSLQAKAEEW